MRALVLGELCTDVILFNPRSVLRFGEPAWAEEAAMRLGGSASYAAQALRRLGLEVHLLGVLGEGMVATSGLKQLEIAGINLGHVIQKMGIPTPVSIAISSQGQKHFVGCTPLLEFEPELLEVSLQGTDLIYVGGYLLYPELWDGSLTRFLQRVKNSAFVAVDLQILPIDANSYRARALKPENLIGVDVLLANRGEAESLTGRQRVEEAAESLAETGAPMIVVKMGSQGSLAWTKERSHQSGAFEVQARDLIGAGDFFGAAFAFGQIQGWGIDKSSDFANAYAAICVSRLSTEDLPSETEVLAFMRTYEQSF